ncbi:MAG: HAMP domain-containing sensor histidine kinase [Rhizomicrobium sp.]
MIPHFKSILARIIWLHVIALTMAAIAVPIAAYLLLNSTATSFENETLRAHADTIARYLKPKVNGTLDVDLPPDLRTFYAHGFGGFAFAIVDSTGRLVFSSQANQLPTTGDIYRRDKPQYFQRTENKSSYFAGSIPERVGGRTVWIQITQDLQHPDVIIDDIVADFLRRVAWFTIPIIFFVLVVDILVVRRALRPVIAASDRARTIDPNRLDLRLPTQNLPSEILPLIETINQALARLERGFRIQREFTADAAHELRTPLSVLRLRLDNLPDGEPSRLLRADVDTMSHIVNQLLDAAELEATDIAIGDTADLLRVCQDVVALIAPLALSQNKDIAFTGCETPIWIKGNAAMLFQAIRNLVENAVKYTPEGTTVEVVVETQGIVRVLDEGPGVREEDRELIFHRFWRQDRSHADGAGLGLAIVARVAQAHAGSINVEHRAGGGAVFSLDLTGARLAQGVK